ncbi:MAG TPA: MBL fold metallo-hydrolase [Candidatus Eisenbacteria bacterium]
MSQGHVIPEITGEELVRDIEAGVPIRVLDVRASDAVQAGRIDIVPPERFVHIRGSRILAMGAKVKEALPSDGPIAVVCGHGNSSKQVALILNGLGFTASSLRGGMAAWAHTVVPRRLEPPAGFDELVQFDRVAKGAVGYLVAAGGEALLVDPPRKAQPYLDYARTAGYRVVAVADTHVHADYLSGAPSVSRALGVPYYLHPADAVLPYDGTAARIEFTPVEEGSEIPVGGARVRVMHTPGHTEGSVTYFAGDGVALTGDFVFVRSIGRPDLGGKAEEWTPVLWKSLERARREWPASLRIHPAHYANDGERESDRSIGRTFGAVRAANEPLEIADEKAFTDWVMTRVGSSPAAYRKIKTVNLGLLEIFDVEAEELEGGRNECALT